MHMHITWESEIHGNYKQKYNLLFTVYQYLVIENFLFFSLPAKGGGANINRANTNCILFPPGK